MTIVTQYIVERNGKSMKTFASKRDADVYDKMLGIADDIYDFIEQVDMGVSELVRENLSLYLAENKDLVISILKGCKPSIEKTATQIDDNQKTDNKITKEAEKEGVVSIKSKKAA